jgi:hypothetical protein
VLAGLSRLAQRVTLYVVLAVEFFKISRVFGEPRIGISSAWIPIQSAQLVKGTFSLFYLCFQRRSWSSSDTLGCTAKLTPFSGHAIKASTKSSLRMFSFKARDGNFIQVWT